MLERKIESVLREWKDDPDNKTLLIDGCRQIGKTFSISNFIKKNFQYSVELNCLFAKDFDDLMKDVQSADEFIRNLSFYSPSENIVPHKTAIFIDEIQALKKFDIITFSKIIALDKRFKLALSGSLLGVSLKSVASWPVGYIVKEVMHPLDFEEFLWAKGVDKHIYNELNNNLKEETAVNDTIHKRLLKYFYEYLTVGGMPNIVQNYILHQDLKEANQLKLFLNSAFESDISKYFENRKKIRVLDIYENIPNQLRNKDLRFHVREFSKNPTRDMISDDFVWLSKAGVAIPVYNSTSLEHYLRMSLERSVLKLFLMDVGILTTLISDSSLQKKLLMQEEETNMGAIFENFVAEELSAHGFENLYFFNNKKIGEIDFVIEKGADIIPLEVKSGKDFKIHKALNNLLNSYPSIHKAYVFSTSNIEKDGNITYLPIYMIGLIKKYDY